MIVFVALPLNGPPKLYPPAPEGGVIVAVRTELRLIQFRLFALVKVAVGGVRFCVTTTEAVAVQPFAAFTVTV